MNRKRRTRKTTALKLTAPGPQSTAQDKTASDDHSGGKSPQPSPSPKRANGTGAKGANGSNGTAADSGSQAAPAQSSGGAPVEPLQKGDTVVIRMRSDWELEGELRAINDEVVRIFDFAVRDVLLLRRKDIQRIERLVDAD